jgi:hypothetical protein
MTEEWRVIPSFPSYEVSDLGGVRRCLPGNRTHVGRVKVQRLLDGYWTVGLSEGNVPKVRSVHKLVAEAFLPPKPSPKHEVAHENGIRTNNNASNLRWATRKENHADMREHGTQPRGSAHANSKLTEADVLAIRSSDLGSPALAKEYGVSRTTIKYARRGKNWAHVNG